MNDIKQAFLNSKKTLEPIEVPELGTKVYIGKWSARQRSVILPDIIAIGDESNKDKYSEMVEGMAKVVQGTLKDIEGNRVFEDTAEDLAILLDFDGEVIEKLFNKILDYNGIGENAIPEAAKN